MRNSLPLECGEAGSLASAVADRQRRRAARPRPLTGPCRPPVSINKKARRSGLSLSGRALAIVVEVGELLFQIRDLRSIVDDDVGLVRIALGVILVIGL